MHTTSARVHTHNTQTLLLFRRSAMVGELFEYETYLQGKTHLGTSKGFGCSARYTLLHVNSFQAGLNSCPSPSANAGLFAHLCLVPPPLSRSGWAHCSHPPSTPFDNQTRCREVAIPSQYVSDACIQRYLTSGRGHRAPWIECCRGACARWCEPRGG